MTIHTIKQQYVITTAYEVPKIMDITEEELCKKFDERFPENNDPPHEMEDLHYVYPEKDAVELALEETDENWAVHRQKRGVRLIKLEEVEEVDWI